MKHANQSTGSGATGNATNFLYEMRVSRGEIQNAYGIAKGSRLDMGTYLPQHYRMIIFSCSTNVVRNQVVTQLRFLTYIGTLFVAVISYLTSYISQKYFLSSLNIPTYYEVQSQLH